MNVHIFITPQTPPGTRRTTILLSRNPPRNKSFSSHENERKATRADGSKPFGGSKTIAAMERHSSRRAKYIEQCSWRVSQKVYIECVISSYHNNDYWELLNRYCHHTQLNYFTDISKTIHREFNAESLFLFYRDVSELKVYQYFDERYCDSVLTKISVKVST